MELPERISFDRVADIYDETRAIPEPEISQVLDSMDKNLDKQDRLLDLGVGTGRFALPLQARGYDVVGIDISEKMLNVGAFKGFRYPILADACCLPFKDNAFHSTLSVHLLHLLCDWVDALEEAIRVTRENFMTVGRFWLNEDTPIKYYEQLLIESGHYQGSPGYREKELPEQVEPYVSDLVAIRRDVVDADEAIRRVQDRIYAFQWDIPDHAHEMAAEEARIKYSGERLEVEEEIYLFVWRIGNLEESIEGLREIEVSPQLLPRQF
jgi:ubiquinone/menaquinone biosynthesis C-methylase UbiE